MPPGSRRPSRLAATFASKSRRKALIGETGAAADRRSGRRARDLPRLGLPTRDPVRERTASGPTVRYYVMDGATAAVVAEGGLKPDAGLWSPRRTPTLVKIAVTSVVVRRAQR